MVAQRMDESKIAWPIRPLLRPRLYVVNSRHALLVSKDECALLAEAALLQLTLERVAECNECKYESFVMPVCKAERFSLLVHCIDTSILDHADVYDVDRNEHHVSDLRKKWPDLSVIEASLRVFRVSDDLHRCSSWKAQRPKPRTKLTVTPLASRDNLESTTVLSNARESLRLLRISEDSSADDNLSLRSCNTSNIDGRHKVVTTNNQDLLGCSNKQSSCYRISRTLRNPLQNDLHIQLMLLQDLTYRVCILRRRHNDHS